MYHNQLKEQDKGKNRIKGPSEGGMRHTHTQRKTENTEEEIQRQALIMKPIRTQNSVLFELCKHFADN